MFQRFPQERISESILTGRERPHPSVSNLRVFDDVQILEKIADQVQITQQERLLIVRGPDRGRVHSPSSGGNSREKEILEVTSCFRQSAFPCAYKFLLESSRSSHPEAWDPLMESFTAEFVVQANRPCRVQQFLAL